VIGTSTTAAAAPMFEWGVDVPVHVRNRSSKRLGATGDAGADVIVDVVAAAADNPWPGDRRPLDRVGRVDGGSLDLNEFARKRLELIGVTFRTRSLYERIQVVDRFVASVLPGLVSGALKPKVDRVFDLAEAAAAQEHVRSGRHFGKVVLNVKA
jgi:NADPH:quinone reductase-like Zn-dependent oxidoreductase